jgi:hypothetical protein
MLRFAGKNAIILEEPLKGCYILDIDNKKWKWAEDMFIKKWTFNLDELKTEDIAINCTSREDAKSFLDHLTQHDIGWKNGGIKSDPLRYNIYGSDTIYEIHSNGALYFGRIGDFKGTIYDYRDIVFPRPEKKTENRILTKKQLEERGLITGDIVFTKDGSVGIVMNNWISYINETAWDDIDKAEIIKIIPKEFINSDVNKIPFLISRLFKSKVIDPNLEQYILKIGKEEKPPQNCNIYKIQFTQRGRLYDFVSYDETIEAGDFVLANGNNGNRKYGKVMEVTQRLLTSKEISAEYKYCRKA